MTRYRTGSWFPLTTARSAGRDIYPDPTQAKADLSAALKTAAQSHKRIILDFGGHFQPTGSGSGFPAGNWDQWKNRYQPAAYISASP